MSRCAVARCDETFDLKPVSFDVEAVSHLSIGRPKIVFDDVELCGAHRGIFDTTKHTVFAHSKPRRTS